MKRFLVAIMLASCGTPEGAPVDAGAKGTLFSCRAQIACPGSATREIDAGRHCAATRDEATEKARAEACVGSCGCEPSCSSLNSACDT